VDSTRSYGGCAADDWIVENVQPDDIVITADVPLASRCLEQGAHVIGSIGKPFTENNIGQAVATRDLLSKLRGAGGPRPRQKRDRSRFPQRLGGGARPRPASAGRSVRSPRYRMRRFAALSGTCAPRRRVNERKSRKAGARHRSTPRDTVGPELRYRCLTRRTMAERRD